MQDAKYRRIGTIARFGGCSSVTEFCQVQNSHCVLQVLSSPIGSVTARQSSNGREPKFAALSTGHHLYSAGLPLRWALAHILVRTKFVCRQRTLPYNATWTVVYTTRPVLAALQTSHRRRHDAAVVTPGEPQSREAMMWLVGPTYYARHQSACRGIQ